MEYKRSDRVADLLWKEIAEMVFRRVKDPRVENITITGVEVTDDLKLARVYFTVMGTPGEEDKKAAETGLTKARGFMRQELGKRLHVKHLPDLVFHYDTSFEYGAKMERILRDLHKDE